MCIIVAKKAGLKMPSNTILENCFKNNPDGAGFMLASSGLVHGFKGFMTLDAFKEGLLKAEAKYGDLDMHTVVMHFRITTHGGTNPNNTHPFPIKGGYDDLKATQWHADQGFAHNGIISSYGANKDVDKYKVSDTMVFAKHCLIPLGRYVNIASDSGILDMLYDIADSKLCFIDKKGNLAFRGDFIDDGGILYSNSSYSRKREYIQTQKKYFSPYPIYRGYDFYRSEWWDEEEAEDNPYEDYEEMVDPEELEYIKEGKAYFDGHSTSSHKEDAEVDVSGFYFNVYDYCIYVLDKVSQKFILYLGTYDYDYAMINGLVYSPLDAIYAE